MKPSHRSLIPAKDILLDLFDGEVMRLAGFLLQHTYFLPPDCIRRHRERTGSAAWDPNAVRASRQHHKGKQRKESSDWNGRTVKVYDNTRARLAFAAFSGLKMSGNVEGRIRGYHVAHIWENVFDPDYFTAGWNLCLMPGFLKLFTEQQDRIPLSHQVIQQAAFDLYFKTSSIGLPAPECVTDPGLNLSALFPQQRPNKL